MQHSLFLHVFDAMLYFYGSLKRQNVQDHKFFFLVINIWSNLQPGIGWCLKRVAGYSDSKSFLYSSTILTILGWTLFNSSNLDFSFSGMVPVPPKIMGTTLIFIFFIFLFLGKVLVIFQLFTFFHLRPWYFGSYVSDLKKISYLTCLDEIGSSDVKATKCLLLFIF